MSIPLITFPGQLRPYTQITPFTYRDGATYLEVLESLRRWIRKDLVTHLNTEVAGLTESWATNIDELLLAVSTAITTSEAGIADTDAELRTFVTDTVNSIINSTVSVSDATILAVLNEADSDARDYLDVRYALATVTASALDDLEAAITALTSVVSGKASVASVTAISDTLANGARLGADTLDGRFNAKGDKTAVDALNALTSGAGRLADAQLEAKYGPLVRSGTYAARPAFGTVKTGTLYYASDTLETYRATGVAGAAATGWAVVPTGGTELAYVETAVNQTVATGTGTVDITGLLVSVVVPERPFMLKFESTIAIATTAAGARVKLIDITAGGAGVVLHDWYGGQSSNANEYVPAYFEHRLANLTPGTTRQYKVAVQQNSTISVGVQANALYPTWLQAVTV